jgi:hypothetical protein
MKGMTKVRSELSSKLVLLQGDVDLNNDQIARLQEQNVEMQGQIEAVSKVLDLIGSAWVPPKKATKKFIKKKAAITGRGCNSKRLNHALARDRHSSVPLAVYIAAFEETAGDTNELSLQQFFLSVNARSTKKLTYHTFEQRVNNMTHSPHRELSSIFSKVRRGNQGYVSLNRDAADHFKKLAKKFA